MQPESENTVDPDVLYDGYTADYKGKMKNQMNCKRNMPFLCRHWQCSCLFQNLLQLSASVCFARGVLAFFHACCSIIYVSLSISYTFLFGFLVCLLNCMAPNIYSVCFVVFTRAALFCSLMFDLFYICVSVIVLSGYFMIVLYQY